MIVRTNNNELIEIDNVHIDYHATDNNVNEYTLITTVVDKENLTCKDIVLAKDELFHNVFKDASRIRKGLANGTEYYEIKIKSVPISLIETPY